MEDEQGEVGPESGTVSESSELPSKPPVEKLGGESDVEGDDGGEVMVEVVGSDVFVDGVSGQKEGQLGFREIGDLEGNVEKNGEETGVRGMEASNEGDGDRIGENEVESLGMGERDNINVSEAVNIGHREVGGGKEGSVGKNEEELRVISMGVLKEGNGDKNGENEVRVLGQEVVVSFREPIDVGDGNGGGKERFVWSREVGDLKGNVDKKNGEESKVDDIDVSKEGNGLAKEEVDVGMRESDGSGGVDGGKKGIVKSKEDCDLESIAGKNGEETGANAMDVSDKENCGKIEESEVRNEGTTDELNHFVTDEVNAGISELQSKGVDDLDNEVVRIEAVETMPGKIEEVIVGNPNITHEEKAIENEAVDKSSARPEEVDEQKSGTSEEEELLSMKGEVVDMASPKDGDFGGNMESLEAESVDDKEVLAVESEDSVKKTHFVGGQDENQSSLKESKIMSETSHGLDDTHKEMIPDDNKESNTKCDEMEVDFVEPEKGASENTSETNKLKLLNEETTRLTSSMLMDKSGYLLHQENEGHFTKSDLVWGKVRSHPWWPGQIFDPEDASEAANKYYKKDSYLVAYFGDRTFAWNDASVLKPFRQHFSQTEKQRNSEAFQNAVDCAMEEVSRRIELGLACSCIPKDVYSKIEYQIVENSGIRDESCRRYGVDRSTGAALFEPDKLLDYIRDLARCASLGADRLDLVIIQAQLSAFCCFKGYHFATEFPSSGELLENEVDKEEVTDKTVVSKKHKPKDGSSFKKERSLVELMGDGEFYPDMEDESALTPSGRKRKALDALNGGLEKRPTVSAAKLSSPTSQSSKPSFRIGECIRRVASQLTAPAPLVKGNDDETITNGSPNINDLSVDEVLSQLEMLALNPKRRDNLPSNSHNFILGFRSSIALNKRGRKRKAEKPVGGSAEGFEFDDVNDSYWMDRIVHNYPEEQLLHNGENGDEKLQSMQFHEGKPVNSGRKRPYKKRHSTGNYPTETTPESEEIIKRKKQQSSPAELVLNFSEKRRMPSEINLNKMFRRFGSLMESETEVDHESGCAKVIFKRGSDAEVALNSAEKFNIFGSVVVTYEIGYSPIISVKILPVSVPQLQEDEVPQLQEDNIAMS